MVTHLMGLPWVQQPAQEPGMMYLGVCYVQHGKGVKLSKRFLVQLLQLLQGRTAISKALQGLSKINALCHVAP